MKNRFLRDILFQVVVISCLYFVLAYFELFHLSFRKAMVNLFSLTFVFIMSGLILFLNLKKDEPIAGRFLIMTTVQMLSFLSIETAFIYTDQPVEIVYHGLIFFFAQFIFQTIFLVRIQKK